jgi:pre-mRNA-splicing factor 38B
VFVCVVSFYFFDWLSQPCSLRIGSDRDPSTAFCLLLRLLTLRCTEKQMSLLLEHQDSPYIRAIGFLYLRYAGDPETIWKWIEPYIYDDEPLQVQNNASKINKSETIGDYVQFLFSNKDYYGTILPRFPIQFERDLQVKLLQAEKIEERAKKNASNPQRMNFFKTLGSKVVALYGDDENPVTWYEGVVERVITTHEETGSPLRNPKFVVTFPEYGNTETVTLGEMEMLGSNLDAAPERGGHAGRGGYSDRPRDDNRGYGDRGRGYGRDRGDGDRGYDSHRRDDHRRGPDSGRGGRPSDRWERGSGGRPAAALPSEHDLYEEVRRRERDTVTANGRRRPPSTKSSLSGHSNDRQRHSPSPAAPRGAPKERSPPPSDSSGPAPRKRTAEETSAIQDKKRRLMAKYG